MRLGAALRGDLRKILYEERKAAARAIRLGMRETGTGLRNGHNADAKRAGLKKIAKWRMKVFSGKSGPWAMAVMVYPQGGERLRNALWAHAHGAVIKPQSGRFLAIPTGFNKPRGFRKAGGGPLVSTEEMARMKNWTYVVPGKNGSLVWFLKVTSAQEKTGRGSVRTRAFAGGMRLAGRGAGDVGSGRGRRVRDILKQGAVPMFVLVPQVRISKKLNMDAITRRWADQLPGNVVKHWKVQ